MRPSLSSLLELAHKYISILNRCPMVLFNMSMFVPNLFDSMWNTMLFVSITIYIVYINNNIYKYLCKYLY